MKQRLFLMLIILLSFKGISQNFDFGKVNVKELEEKTHPKDPSAVAAIVFQKGRSYFEFNQVERDFKLVTDVVVRVKIYKEEGFGWANKEISYYSAGNQKETVTFSDICTYNLLNGKVVKDKFRKGDESEKKINQNISLKKITPSNVKEGSIVEYRYTISTANVAALPCWEFELGIPVNYSEFEVNIPEFYLYKTYLKGSIRPTEQKKIRTKVINIEKPSRFRPIYNAQKIDDYIGNQSVFSFNEYYTKYVAENVSALKSQVFTNNIQNYSAKICFEFSGFLWSKSNEQKAYRTWDDVVKNIYESDGFGDQIKESNYFAEAVNKITDGLTSNDEKIAAIYNYVKSNVKWDGYTGLYCDKGVKKAFEEKTGNVAEINLMLTAMLRFAGVDTNPVLLSTRSNGLAFYPTRTAFNYVIAAVEIENGLILLDATDQNALPNILPERALNWTGRIIRQNGSSAEVDLTPETLSRKAVTVMATIGKDGSVSGKVREQYHDYYAYDLRSRYGGLTEESYLEKLEKKRGGIEIEAYKISNKSDLSKQVVEDYSFKHTGLLETMADKLYINPMLFFTESENPFKQDKREYPIDFLYPNQDRYTISLTIPEGYTVESVPAPINLSMEQGLGNFSFNIVTNGSQIQLVASLSVNSAVVPASYYEMLKNFYKDVVEKNKEKIVLKKA